MTRGLDRYRLHIPLVAVAVGLASTQLPTALSLVLMLALIATVVQFKSPLLIVVPALLFCTAAEYSQARVAAIDATAIKGTIARQFDVTLLGRPKAHKWDSSAPASVETGVGVERVLLKIGRQVRWPNASIGDILRIRGRLSTVGTGPEWWLAYLKRKGVHGKLTVRDASVVARRTGAVGWLDSARRRADAGIGAGLSGDSAALLRGMVLGGDEAFSTSARDQFRRSGLAHIVAVSGANVLLLVILLEAMLGAARVRRRLRTALVIGAIPIYVLLCGADPAVVRAGVMGVAGIVALRTGRASSRSYAMLLAATVILALNPRSIADVGAQMSFAAVIGIWLIARPLVGRLDRVPRVAAEAFSVTIAATVATAPVSAIHFGTLSLAGLLANVVAAPAIAPAVWLGFLSAFVGQAAPLAASLLNGVAIYPLAYLLWVADWTSGLPSATIEVRDPLRWAVVFVIAGLAGAIAHRILRRSVVIGVSK